MRSSHHNTAHLNRSRLFQSTSGCVINYIACCPCSPKIEGVFGVGITSDTMVTISNECGSTHIRSVNLLVSCIDHATTGYALVLQPI
jgi:hypothetical protein